MIETDNKREYLLPKSPRLPNRPRFPIYSGRTKYSSLGTEKFVDARNEDKTHKNTQKHTKNTHKTHKKHKKYTNSTERHTKNTKKHKKHKNTKQGIYVDRRIK